MVDVTSNAGNGHKEQDGGSGERAPASGHTVRSTFSDCLPELGNVPFGLMSA